ncbi:uncharacterized protein LOC133803969 [Humulus lupulus]|uniref:uncharacterized protein LOC133803969 n=1 Tax=Humulus lupulus TaxID=3486 RepID=UPI002B404AC5|nr:uncharacterized protein LOC133803969 [Humulus lupulus]XP_062098100.1 uncharacterized protein LOC133803969 [Humulus lupulus]XP_062098101.1 uncharacterized protein LOC133803969 [Humulus lupulus]
MVNSNLENNVWGNSRTALPTYHKQSPLALKKVALRDVQNDNRRFISYGPESSCVRGAVMDSNSIKVFGTKILTSECPCSPPRIKSLEDNGSNELEADAGISLDLELGKRRNRDTAEENAVSVNLKRYLEKQPNLPEQPAKKRDHEKSYPPAFAPTSAASVIVSPEKSDQYRMERFIHLQKVLKQCDESDQRDYIQMLLCLSPLELSRHAVELEKRSMQLSVEEAREIQRMRTMDILGTSSNDRSPGFERSQSKN